MRLGAPVFIESDDPFLLAEEHVKKGYRAAYAPAHLSLEDAAGLRECERAFAGAGVAIAEVGAWCNPLDRDGEKARQNREFMKERLAFADEVGALCCVNILGSYAAESWHGYSPDGYSEGFFAECVDVAREVIDAVRPKRTKLAFEMMPFMFLDGPEEYLRFLRAVDRRGAGVHVDMCNCISSPRLLKDCAGLTRRAFALLGEDILSIHAKDITVDPLPSVVSFKEVLMPRGGFDHGALLQCAAALKRDVPVMLEHLSSEAEYDSAAGFLKGKAKELGLSF